MVDLKGLYVSIESRMAVAYEAVKEAEADLVTAKSRLQKAQDRLNELAADAERRIAAIALVEEMITEASRAEHSHPYRDMGQEEAMRLCLRKAGQSMNSTELADALKDGGYPFRSANPANSIVVAANTNRNGFFTTAKEGNRTLIGLVEWGNGGMIAPNPFDDDALELILDDDHVFPSGARE